LAKQYGVSETTLMKKANAEKWNQLRREADSKAAIKAQQKTADIAANNATKSERIRAKLLNILEREVDALPDSIGTELYKNTSNMAYEGEKGGRMTKRNDGGKKYKLTDLTRAYRDLVDDRQIDVNIKTANHDALNEAFEALKGDAQ
jgi:hypothetical protein